MIREEYLTYVSIAITAFIADVLGVKQITPLQIIIACCIVCIFWFVVDNVISAKGEEK